VIAAFAPIWVLTAIGYAARRLHLLEGRAEVLLGRFVFTLAMPVALFLTLSRTPLSGFEARPLVAFAAGALIAIAIGWLASASLFHRKAPEPAIWGMAGGYVNAANLGLPVAMQILGDVSFLVTVILLQTMVLAPVILGTLDRGTDSDGRLRLRRVLALPVRNPVILGSACGVLASALDLRPTGVLLAALGLLAKAAVPAALIALGASLHRDDPPGDGLGWGLSMVVVLKLVAQPLLAYGFAAWVLHLPPAQVLAVTVCAGLPTAQNAFVFAQQYRVGEAMAGRAVLATTTLSLGTLVVVAALAGG
jgi:predicted permease